MDWFIPSLHGFAINLIAIISYLDFARSGAKGFKRLLAFWIGMPLTLLMKLVVRPDPDLVLERKLSESLPDPEGDIGVPEYVRKEIRAIRQKRLREERLAGEPGAPPEADSGAETGD